MSTIRIPAILAVVGLISFNAHSQSLAGFGLKAGVAVSTIHVTTAGSSRFPSLIDYTDESLTSPYAGLFVTFSVCDNLGLQCEISYLRKGSSKTNEYPVTTAANPDGTGETVRMTTDLGVQYLSLNVTARPGLRAGDVVVYAIVGPNISYVLTANNLVQTGNSLNKAQVGYTLGLGADLTPVLGRNLFLEVSYLGDFRYFYDTEIGKFWNQSWIISIGTSL
jgi:opacity protein-like surface antigen